MSASTLPFSLKGKSILIAGGAGYLAAPVAALAANLGANLCIADRDPDRLKTAATELGNRGFEGDIFGIDLDIGDENSINACIDACAARFGYLDGFVNATFGSTGKRLEDLTSEDFDRANRVNLTGAFLMARKVAEQMEQGGSILMYASMYGLVAPNPAAYPEGLNPNPIEYGAGKAGLAQMVRYLAAHYGPRNVRVNAIAPGPFPNLNTTGWNKPFVKNLEQHTMLGRTGEQHETAGAATFLLSPAASYITGQVLSVDGGWTAW
ncbi:SDR family oxidoreductase [Devosia rhodophyticola]|uniref:SDR family oxidoreductase n=1 Tax=Devosia rhodophyticola TaxID=3026423 RepID=A0ABY7YXT9_9HYPH|nr:SDR family oxidoreductase [Devosia rhodophyticola]WDR06203.1 SDR family oxidoreductase [Devosia rhodophyticola]